MASEAAAGWTKRICSSENRRPGSCKGFSWDRSGPARLATLIAGDGKPSYPVNAVPDLEVDCTVEMALGFSPLY